MEGEMRHKAESDLILESGPTFNAGRKLSEAHQILLWQHLRETPEHSSISILRQMESVSGRIPISIRHINRLRVGWGMNRKKGRPRRSEPAAC